MKESAQGQHRKAVLVTSRFFGRVTNEGVKLLEPEFEITFLYPEKGTLSEQEVLEGVVEHKPWAIITGIEPVTSRVLAAAENLRVISVHGTGTEHVDVEEAKRRGIVVTNTPGTNAVSVAEFTVGLILATARHICQAYCRVRKGGWEERSLGCFMGTELYGKCVGIIGTGMIGQAVMRRLAGFDVRFLLYDKIKTQSLLNTYPAEYVELDRLLEESDIVTIHVPLTRETHHLIDAEALSKLKSTAILINTSRGGVVDEDALIEALSNGRLAGAGLDVLALEPPIPTNPLLHLDNVVVTPHIGGGTMEAVERTDVMCAKNILSQIHGINKEVMKGSITSCQGRLYGD